jgi:hypothetical protein
LNYRNSRTRGNRTRRARRLRAVSKTAVVLVSSKSALQFPYASVSSLHDAFLVIYDVFCTGIHCAYLSIYIWRGENRRFILFRGWAGLVPRFLRQFFVISGKFTFTI